MRESRVRKLGRWLRDWLARLEPARTIAAVLSVVALVSSFAYVAVARASRHIATRTSLRVALVCHRLDPTVVLGEGTASDKKAMYATLGEDPFKYPTYLVQIMIENDRQVSGLRIRVAGLTSAVPWGVWSTAFRVDPKYLAGFPTRFAANPDGVLLPDLPTIGPSGITTIRTIVRSDDEDLCSSEWITVTHPSLKPLVLRENLQAMSMVTIESNTLIVGVPALAGFATLLYLGRRRVAAAGCAAWRAFRSRAGVAPCDAPPP